ncbi:MAG: hypothetical protein ACOY3D_04335 [Candidatus Omnitrophota bacterium]
MSKGKGIFSYLLAFGLVVLLGSFVFAEETAPQAAVNAEAAAATVAAPAVTAAPAAEEAAVPVEETRWLWAEVIAVDAANKQFTVKYLSYDSDEEKEMVLGINDATKLENFSALAEMAAGDNVSIDYVMDPAGKALAKSISLQKAKPTAAAPTVEPPAAKPEEAKPEAAKPAVEPAAAPAVEPAAPVTEQK